MGKLLPCTKIIGGSIGRVGDTFQVSVKMIRLETGEIEFAAKQVAKGATDNVILLTEETARQLALQYADERKGKK